MSHFVVKKFNGFVADTIQLLLIRDLEIYLEIYLMDYGPYLIYYLNMNNHFHLNFSFYLP